MGTQTEKVRFNVRGKIFETTATTLSSAGRNSVFGAMFDDEWNLQSRDVNGEYFIDRNPDCFSVLVDLLGTGGLHVPPNVPIKLLYREANYYGLLDHVRTASWDNFDGNRSTIAATVSARGPHNFTAIRASPHGGCAVAHGGIVRVYDWMLEQHSPLNLDYKQVNDIGWINPEIIVTTGVGGMATFSCSTGELRHRFQIHDQVKDGFAAGVLCLNPDDNKVFASCYQGISAWDHVGKHKDFIRCPGAIKKIQWVHENNCLLAMTEIDHTPHIKLLDFRNKRAVWSRPEKTKIWHYRDFVAMDESKFICVVDSSGSFDFYDLRNINNSVTHYGVTHYDYLKKFDNYIFPKLTSHGGQLFCSTEDKISVYSGRDDNWVLTSILDRSQGGLIRDFSIGGDRLFALHSEKNTFDVWETPSAPII